MTNPLLQRLIDIAVAEVGRKEEPGHPNTGPEVVKYQRATWLAPGPWPWCAAFVDWCLQKWATAPDVQAALQIRDLEHWRCKDARAFGVETWADQHGYRLMDENALAKAGDIITFDFSHIGFVTADEVLGYPLQTVEGNTNSEGSRDGDGVWRKKRADSLTRKYIRMLP